MEITIIGLIGYGIIAVTFIIFIWILIGKNGDKKLYAEFIKMMTSLNVIISESELLKEFGSNEIQGKETLTGINKLEQYARELMKTDNYSYPKAFKLALEAHPNCYEEYNKTK